MLNIWKIIVIIPKYYFFLIREDYLKLNVYSLAFFDSQGQ